MIRAILIDDETYIRTDIQDKLNEYFTKEIHVVGEASSVQSGLDVIAKHKPDLIFLDIDLQDGTGFDILTQTTYKKFEIIFITGYDNHAIKAIKVGALDYILKPVDDEEFCDAVNKAIENIKQDNPIDKLIEISNEYFKGVEKKRVIFKTFDTVYALYEDDIIYCHSNGNYTTIYTQQLEKIMVSKPIKKVEELLSENVFIRCHQSYIVNKKHVLKYNNKGVLIVHLNIEVPVSSRRKDFTLKQIFD